MIGSGPRTGIRFMLAAFFVFLLSDAAMASHPLITDDTGTQGTGKFQLEANGEYANDTGNTDTKLSSIFSAGVRENIDIVLSIPYHFLSDKNGAGNRTRTDGIADATMEVKWRFYEKDGTSIALKPGMTFPTGDEDKGLGDGKPGYSIFFILQKEKKPFTALMNLGYVKNRLELRDIFHASLAGEYEATERLTVVGNVGIETNPDRASNTSPAFILGGVIYGVTEKFDLDCGIKAGLTSAEPDYTLLAGMTLRF